MSISPDVTDVFLAVMDTPCTLADTQTEMIERSVVVVVVVVVVVDDDDDDDDDDDVVVVVWHPIARATSSCLSPDTL